MQYRQRLNLHLSCRVQSRPGFQNPRPRSVPKLLQTLREVFEFGIWHDITNDQTPCLCYRYQTSVEIIHDNYQELRSQDLHTVE